MANAFSDYEIAGPAEPRRTRAAAVIDLSIGAFLALLVWPFPIVRIVTTDATGSVAFGWAVHVLLLLAFMVVADWAYAAIVTTVLRRTAGMYLQDLGFREGPPRGMAIASVAAVWTMAGVAGVLGATRPSARFNETRLGSTKTRAAS
jgi:hypothetical protein